MVFGFSRRDELPQNPQMDFTEIKNGYACHWDEAELRQYVPYVIIPDESYISFKGVFGRVVEYGNDARCYQYIYLWDGQLFPPHPMDYEPVLVYVFDKLESKAIIYDHLHYKIGRFWINESTAARLRVVYPWHSFRRGRYLAGDIDIHPLTDDHLNHWWKITDSRARLTITDDIRHPFRLLGSNDIRNEKIPEIQLILAWARLPFLAYVKMARDLGSCLMDLFRNVVQVARLRLRNPGYERIAAGYLLLLKTLENYHIIELEPSIKGNFTEVEKYDSKFSKTRFLKTYSSELENWEPKEISSGETGSAYFDALQKTVLDNRLLVGTLDRWLDSFRKKTKS